MRIILLFFFLYTVALGCYAQTNKEPVAIFEFGGASSWNVKSGSAYGYSVSAEVTPIENWLELEMGVSRLYSSGSNFTEIDVLFKKPWDISKKFEFMAGIGPAWSHEKGSHSWSGEAALDLMWWPWPRRRIGWYVEPAYEYGFSSGHERSLGMSAGLLISVP